MKKFYEVTFEGTIERYNFAQPDRYYYTCITKCSDDDHRIVDDSAPTDRRSMRILNKEGIEDGINRGIFFLNLQDALAKSEVLWNEYFAPDAKWCVYGVFDNVEVTYKSEPMSKTEAKAKLAQCCDSIYTKYFIRKVE